MWALGKPETIFWIFSTVLFAMVIFVVTNWLVIQGGHVNAQGEQVVGPHLALLGQFFIGLLIIQEVGQG